MLVMNRIEKYNFASGLDDSDTSFYSNVVEGNYLVYAALWSQMLLRAWKTVHYKVKTPKLRITQKVVEDGEWRPNTVSTGIKTLSVNK